MRSWEGSAFIYSKGRYLPFQLFIHLFIKWEFSRQLPKRLLIILEDTPVVFVPQLLCTMPCYTTNTKLCKNAVNMPQLNCKSDLLCAESVMECPHNCYGNGECVSGTCNCFPGFLGPYCSRGVCSIVMTVFAGRKKEKKKLQSRTWCKSLICILFTASFLVLCHQIKIVSWHRPNLVTTYRVIECDYRPNQHYTVSYIG